jgi:hypothetical protein
LDQRRAEDWTGSEENIGQDASKIIDRTAAEYWAKEEPNISQEDSRILNTHD